MKLQRTSLHLQIPTIITTLPKTLTLSPPLSLSTKMGSRIPSHKRSGGLYVSGRPETPPSLTRPPSLSSRPAAGIYTGGDVHLSGELAKMFDITTTSSTSSSKPTRTVPNSDPTRPNSGTNRPNSGPARPNSGPARSNSGPNSGQARSNSGQIGPTGLITSGRRSGQLEPGQIISGRRSGQLEPGRIEPIGKTIYGAAVTDLGKGGETKIRLSRLAIWVLVVAVVVAMMVGVFVTVAVRENVFVVVVAVGVVVVVGVGIVTWNVGWRRRGVVRYWKGYSDVELRGAVDGQYVKVTGVVTCGSIPLESSFQRVPRCVYASTELYEYRGWGGKSANPKHCFFSWGCRQAEKYVADFYISDFQSGLRALVKSGYGAKVSVYVKPTTVVDITKDNRESSPNFLRWLSNRSLSSDDRIMRLKEGYIKEGSTVSVIGIVRRHDNVLMIVPPTEPVSTRCQWFRCLFPTYSEGLLLLCDESQTAEVIAV